MRPGLAPPAVLATVLAAVLAAVLLAGCGGDGGGDDGGDGAGPAVDGAALVAPFETNAQRVYDEQGADRDDPVDAEAGVDVEDCFAVDDEGAQRIGDATGEDGAWTTGTAGTLSGTTGEESLSCPLERDGESAGIDLDLSTTGLDRDDLAGLLTERGYREVDASTDLGDDAVVVLASEDGAGVLAVWIDGGFRVSVGGTGLAEDRAGDVLEAAVTAVSDHLAE